MDSTADFPDDLVQAQHDWSTTYRALAAPHPRHNTALRRRLLRLSVRIWWHPYWGTVRSVPASRMQLHEQARSHGATRSA